MFQVSRITALVIDWSGTVQELGLWQKHFECSGPVTKACCRGGWGFVFMSSQFNNDAQSRYSAIEGKTLTVYREISKALYF